MGTVSEGTTRPETGDGSPSLEQWRRRTGADLSALQQSDVSPTPAWALRGRLPFGGGARTYLAECMDRPGRLGVVKMLRIDALPVDPDRLERELVNARRVRGRFVAEVVESGRTPQPYLVQEFVAGPTLQTLLDKARGPMRTVEAAGLASGLLEALVAVHANQVAHRDLKPRNIIVHSERGPVLIDFGISRHVGDARHTGAGEVIGTPAYMSPERHLGEDGGPASDVFAWGVIAALMFSARHPFPSDGSREEVRRAILGGRPELGALPQAYRKVVGAALRADPDRRPTAVELIARMDAIGRAATAGDESVRAPRTRRDWPAAVDPGRLVHALFGIARAGAERSERDRRELLNATRGPVERLAVRLAYHPRAELLSGRSAWRLITACAAAAGVASGGATALLLQVLWVSLG